MKSAFYLRLTLLLQATAVYFIDGLSVDITKDSLQAFFDEKLPGVLNRTHGVGMTVAIVYKDEIVFQKGYGYSNLEKEIPVDPEQTLFRPGSVSKLFAWTAVMQLLEQGLLDLDADLNSYLQNHNKKVRIPETYPGQPVTMRHLMSHTGGFDDYLFGLFTKDPSKTMTLEEVIRKNMPFRKRLPGKEIDYSNFGAMLAGHIVEAVSGAKSFEEYVEQHILKPLNMTQATFRQPLPDHLQPYMSVGYGYDAKADQVNAREFEIVQGSPAGGFSVSATDMVKFLRAHCAAKEEDSPLLKLATLNRMHSTLLRAHPDINGMAHGFLEIDTYGQRVLGHSGKTIYFQSIAGIVPKHQLGFFWSLNTGVEGGGFDAAIEETYFSFMGHFFNDGSPTGRELANSFDACTDRNQYVGNYLGNRRPEQEPFKLMALAFNLKVAKDTSSAKDGKDGGLLVFNIFTQQMDPYKEISLGVFQAEDGHGRIAFLRDDNTGEVNAAVYNMMPMMTFPRPPLWEEPRLNLAIVSLSLLLLLLGVFVPPLGLLSRFFYQYGSKGKDISGQKTAEWLGFSVVLIYIGFAISIFVGLDSDFFFMGKPPVWPFLIPWAAFAVGLALPVYAIKAWRGSYWGLMGRIFFTVFAFNMQTFFWFLWYWKVAAS